jgi:adenylate cyclase class IV
MIEVEVRGKIRDFGKTLDEFRKKAKFIGEKGRFSLIYFRKGIDASDVRKKEIRDEKVDLRLRVTNKKAEIIMKHGKWAGSDTRKEISIPIPLEKFDDAVELLKDLDWHKGVIMDTKTYVFIYKGIEFAIVHNKSLDYFEAEKLVENKKAAEKELEQIKEICRDFSLIPFDEEDFMDEINKLNNLPERQFDFSKTDFGAIKPKYKEFF